MAKPVGNLFVTVDVNLDKAKKAYKTLNSLSVAAGKTMRRELGGATMAKGAAEGVRRLGEEHKKAQPKIKKTGVELRKTGDSAKKATLPLNQLQTSMYRLSQSFINLRYGNPLGVFAGLTQAATSFGRAMSSVAGKGGPLGLMIGGLTALPILATAAAAGVTLLAGAFAKFGLREAANLEMLRIQYEGLLGSASRGAAEVEYILNLGKTSVVPTEGLLEANRLLLAYGVTADSTRQSLVQFFSDFGSATGLSAARLQDMAYALGQVEAQGRANAIDLRQLANAGLNLALVYEKVAEQQGISVAQAKALTSEGKLTSSILIPAVVALGDNYQEAADKARDSVQGILANLKDIVQINIATAFEDALEKIKPLLVATEEFLEAFDFNAIGEGVTAIIEGVKQGLAGLDTDAASLARTVSTTLAEAFRIVGVVAGNALLITRNGIALVQFMVADTIDWYNRWILATLKVERAMVKWTSFDLRKDEQLAKLDSDIAEIESGLIDSRQRADELKQSLLDLDKLSIDVPVLISVRQRGASEYTSAVNDYLRKQQVSLGAEGKKLSMPVPVTPEPTGGSKSGGSTAQAAKQATDATSQYNKLNQAVSLFNTQVDKPLGSDSAIEKLAFGPNGDGLLVGSSSAVLSQYKQTTKALDDYFNTIIDLAPKAQKAGLRAERDASLQSAKAEYALLYELAEKSERLAKEYADYTQDAINTARQRITELGDAYNAQVTETNEYYDRLIKDGEAALDRATRAYDDANRKLQSMIDERDSFLQSIKSSAYSFVNAIAESSQTLSEVTDLDGVGSFSSVQEQGTASFKEQLEERLEAVKKFRADIENLMSRGLDEGLLRQLVEAGPESGGGLAAALAADSDAAISEINSLQADLASTVGGLQSSLSAAWYDEGIAQQTRVTNQLAAQKAQADANLAALRAAKAEELRLMKEEYDRRVDEQNKLIADLEEGQTEWQINHEKQMTDTAETAGAIITSMQKAIGKLGKKGDGSLYKLGKEAINGLIDGMEERGKVAVKKAESIANRISRTIANAFQIQSPSKVMMGYGENISEGLAIGMENGVSKVDLAAARVANAAFISGDSPKAAAPTVKVFIGDQELRDLVDVQITDASGRDLDAAYAGRRDF